MKNSLLDNPSSAESRGKRIRFVRDHLLSLTRNDFCQNSEITVPALKGWELGWGGGLTPQGAEKIAYRARELNIYCTDLWLLHGVGREAIYLTKDLDIQESDENHIAKELLLFRELNNSIDTVIKDDAMLPLLYPGSYVGGIILENVKNAIGKECIIVDEKDDFYVRILQEGDVSGFYTLVSLNPNTNLVKKEIKNIPVKMAAPIIWIRKLFKEARS